jgi:hypothetical protein
LVIDVGLEKAGLTRSTRLLAGAIGRQRSPFSLLTHVGPEFMVARAVGVWGLADSPSLPALVHALVTMAAAKAMMTAGTFGAFAWRGMP